MEFREYYLNRLARFAYGLLALGILLFGFSGSPGKSVGSVLFYVLKLTACVIVAAKILWSIHGDAVAGKMVNFLLWPRSFLKKAPPPVSRAQTLIVQGKWQEAEELLASWHQEYPWSVQIALTEFNLLADHFQRYGEALQIAVETLNSAQRIRDDQAVILLGRVTDFLESSGNKAKALELLEQEASKKHLYAPQQLQYIKQRENILKKES